MTNYTYSKVSAVNFNTAPATVARSASGSVYAVGDTTYTTPLNMTLVVGGSVVTSISSDANGYFPDFTLLDRVNCVWKQASVAFATVLTTTDPIPGPPGPNTVPTDTAIASNINTAGTATQVALSATYVPRWKAGAAYLAGDKVVNPSGDTVMAKAAFTSGAAYSPANWSLPVAAATTKRLADTGRGAVVLTMDDAYAGMRTVAGWMNARGQKGTFCITPDLMNDTSGVTKILDADILAFAAAGHEIAAHSKTHANMTSLTSVQRAVEYDYPKTYLENLLGAGKVTTWCYPFGTGSGGRNLACDQQMYLRYDRWLDTAMTTQSVSYPRYSDAPPMLINRTAWNENNQQQILTMVRRAASSAIIVPIFFHNLDTAVNPTTANVLEMLDLCQSLGIPLITVSEAFPNPRSLLNAGFEGGLDGVYPAGWHGFTATNGAYSVVTDTPASDYQGTKALELSSTDNTGFAYVRQQVQVIPGRQYTLSGQCKAVSGTQLGVDKAFVRIQSLDYGQAVIAGLDVKMTPVQTVDVGTGWKKFSLDFTAGQGTKTVNVDLGLQATVAGAVIRFDHVWFEPKYQGDLG